MPERLQKVMAARGLASRRRAEQWIASGAVRVNGAIAHLGDLVDPTVDEILVAGKLLAAQSELLYIAFHKPRGYVTSARSTRGEPIVADLIHVGSRLISVGRLDKDTTGLLLLTNDGAWLNAVAHPRYQVEKEYVVEVAGLPTKTDIARLCSGILLPGGSYTSPAQVRLIGTHPSGARLRVTVSEGKKRQIRLMCSAVKHPALELMRVRIGPVRLDGIEEGHWRHLHPTEVNDLAGTN